jgi:TusE/DsrC/DsvC family sulfur relay protein
VSVGLKNGRVSGLKRVRRYRQSPVHRKVVRKLGNNFGSFLRPRADGRELSGLYRQWDTPRAIDLGQVALSCSSRNLGKRERGFAVVRARPGGAAMMRKLGGKTVPLDEEGYLIDPADWEEGVAEHLAREEGIELSGEHWQIIRFMRKYYDEHLITADARFAIKYLSEELRYGRNARDRLFQLFPYGYVKQACKIAGMKRPRAWSTG